MKRSEQAYDPSDPESAILGPLGLSRLLGIAHATAWNLPYRSRERLPPAFNSKPLRWRRSVVLEWIVRQSVAVGRGFVQLQHHGGETPKMTEILRQRDGQLRESARLLVDQPARATDDRSALPESIVRQSQKTAALDLTGPRRHQTERTPESAHSKQGPSLAPNSAPAMGPG